MRLGVKNPSLAPRDFDDEKCGYCGFGQDPKQRGSGGAFGEEIAYSLTKTIVVGGKGELIVNIEGLPEGTTANVSVAGPNAFHQSVTATDTLTNLSPGEYGVLATPVMVDNINYIPNEEYQPVTVVKNETASATVSYESTFGSIYLVVSGLFHGTEGEIPADIRIEGPDSYQFQTDETVLIDSLFPGLYHVYASEVEDGRGQTYIPEPAVSELTVEGDNTAALIINHVPKFGYLNVQVKNLPQGKEGDIDVTGPDDYSHHVTKQVKIDSLLPGEYTVKANPITDNDGNTIEPNPLTQNVSIVAGEEIVAWVDYSGGHDLTISISGLPDGAQANVSISGPESYSASVTKDTTLTELPDGGPYNIILNDITFNARLYYTKTTDPTINIYSDKSISFKYETKAIMSIFLGGVHDPNNPDEETGQFIIRSRASTTNEDTSITEDKYEPQLGGLPQQISLDTCGFEDGRLLLSGISIYSANAAESNATSNIYLTFDVRDSVAKISFDADFKVTSPGETNTTDRASASIQLLLNNMFRIEVFNPNEPGESIAGISMTGIFEILNPAASSSIKGNIKWYSRHHHCNESWSDMFDAFTSFYGNFNYILNSDTTQTFATSMGGGQNVAGGESNEIDMGFRLILTDSSHPGQETRNATVHGEIIIILRQF